MRAVDYILEAAALFIDVDKKWKASPKSDIDIMCHLHCFVMAHTGHNGHSGKGTDQNKYHAVDLERWKLASIHRQIIALEAMVSDEIKRCGVADLAEDLKILGMSAAELSSSFDIVHTEYKKLAR